MSVETRHVRYVFVDVVQFTEDRTLEAQVEIIAAVNNAFITSIGGAEAIYLPTGDGICAGILEVDVPADIHLRVALQVLEYFHGWSSQAPPGRQAQLRVAISESVDAVVTDINGNRNLAGAGINHAQRLMSMADGNQLIASRAAYETLHIRDQYVDSFRELKTVDKHEHIISAYQYTALSVPYLNVQIPLQVRRANPIDLEMSERMAKPGGYTTAGMVTATYEASERWRAEMRDTYDVLRERCNERQQKALAVAQRAWEKFDRAEGSFVAALRETMKGTMYRVLGASVVKELVRLRAYALHNFLDEWIGADEGADQTSNLLAPERTSSPDEPQKS